MRIVMFYHSLLSDWNHGNAHFLRGIVTELLARGHEVSVYEPEDAWSLQNLVAEHGQKPIRKFHAAYPGLQSTRYALAQLDLDRALDGADLVVVHEWNAPELVNRLGEHRQRHGYRLLFHDTHHRMVTAPENMSALRLENYDGVLAYGRILQLLYEASGRVARAWTWHEAADTRIFEPQQPGCEKELDMVWIGNWGDNERAQELDEFLIQPAKDLGLKARIFGVRYPAEAKAALAQAGIDYAGWLPNFEAPKAFARSRFTVHVPRRPYVKALPGIPTIRVFEALACGLPLLCSPWDDIEGLFRPGWDYLVARSGQEMRRLQHTIVHEPELAAELARNGLQTIRSRHTCAHRIDELLAIHQQLEGMNTSSNLCHHA